MAKAARIALGRRLKEAAHARGLSAEALAESLGVSAAAVWAWWSGRNEPAVETLAAYALRTGVTLHWLATGEEEPPMTAAGFADWVTQFADAVMRGEDPAEAFDRVTGDPQQLNPRERRSLSRRAGELRGFISARAGRPWDELSPDERRRLVEELLSEPG